MHESSSCSASLLCRCFRRSLHSVKHDFNPHAFEHHGFLFGSSPQETDEVSYRLRRSLPVRDEPHMSDPSAAPELQQQTSISSLASLLRVCVEKGSISEVRQLHALLIEGGIERHNSLQNPILQSYAKSRALNDASALFAAMHCRLSVVSWNVMISSCLREGKRETSIQYFVRMPAQALVPTKVTYTCIFSVCSTAEALISGKMMHASLYVSQLEASTTLDTAILMMYGRCGVIEYARRTFDDIKDRDVAAWNAMIEIYHQHELHIESLSLFFQMQVEGLSPNRPTLVIILDSCTNLEPCFKGTLVHMYAIDTGLILDTPVATAVVCMYGKTGRLEEGAILFQNSCCERDTVLWNAMIAMYSSHGKRKDALQIVNQMLQEGFLATKITYTSILNACACQAAAFVGKCVHACIFNSEMEMDHDVANAIVHMYGRWGSIEYALCAFQKVQEKDVVLWSAMIAAFAEVGLLKNVLQAFHLMQEKGLTPNKVTIVNILRAFDEDIELNNILEIHDYSLRHGFNEDLAVGTAMVCVYGKYGDLECARIVFNNLSKHDVFSWTALISVCVENGQFNEAFLLFDSMRKEGIVPDKIIITKILSACSELHDPVECDRMHAFIQNSNIEMDEVVGCAMLSMYGRFGKLFFAQTLFNSLQKEQASTWNSMMIVYIQHGQFRSALELFHQMCCNMVVPNKDCLVSALTACANETSLVDGKMVHALICEHDLILSDVVVAALVNMYGKCGCADIARNLFNCMRGNSLILWNAMMSVYAQHGKCRKVLQTMHEMSHEGCFPDIITSISVLNACSHTGLLNEGLQFLAVMEHTYDIFPLLDHYVCLIDMLGRSGRLTEAEILLNHMPFQPKAVSYMSLLGACQFSASMSQGEKAAKCMSELASENAGPYISLSNIYALQSNH